MSEHYFSDAKNPWSFIWIIFEDASHIGDVFREYNADKKTNVFEYSNASSLMQMKEVIVKNNGKIYRASELYEMFLHIFNNHSITQDKATTAEAVYFNYAIRHINTNLFRKITVGELTEILGISQPYLYNIFMKKANISPKKYIDNEKLKKTKELLLKTSMQLTEIANSVGMDDGITFSKFFKSKTGLSPKKYREKNK